jgi:RNA polymerase sigma-70 factor (ECF subfamily)
VLQAAPVEEIHMPHIRETAVDHERSRLARYISLFNAREFDAIRRMLGEEVLLDVVNKGQARGAKAVGSYLDHYSSKYDWRFVLGTVDGELAALACDPLGDLPSPEYFVQLRWSGEKIVGIRDFSHARVVVRDATMAPC